MKTVFTFFLFFMIQSAFAQSDTVIYTFVEEMPRFPGCEDLESDTAKMKCATLKMKDFMDTKLTEIIYSQPIYQEKQCENFIFYVTMVVEKDGSLSNMEIVHGTDEEACRAAVLQVLQKMPKWISGKQRGALVRVLTVVPVKVK